MGDLHDCPEARPFSTVLVSDNSLVFVDEFHHDINYCPYCGESEESIRNERE